MLQIYMFYFLIAISLFFAFTNIIPYHFSPRDTIVGISLLFFCVVTLYQYNGYPIIFIVLLIILSYLCFICRKQLNPLLVILCSLSGYICYILTDNILSQIMLKCFPFSYYNSFYSLFFFFIITMFITYLLTFFIGEILKRSLYTPSLSLTEIIIMALFILLCLSVIIFVFNFIGGKQVGYTSEILTFNAIFIIFYSFITCVIFLIIIWFIHKDSYSRTILEQYHNLEHYTSELENINLRFRSFRHDYLDILSTLSSYIEENDITGLRCTFEDKIAPLNNTINLSIDHLSSLSNIKICELKSLLYAKVMFAQSHNIHTLLDIAENITEIPMDIIDLIRLIGIFFNNAIDELLIPEITNKNLEFGIIKKEGSIIIVLKNTTLADKTILPHIYNLGYSSKGENRGIGLFTAKTIIGRYNNIIHHTTIKDSLFIQTIELYY
ncbi:MAG: GHKL domain-containing protein [Lachnospiraceae bacterium]|nr:GHKL domain-containing protein [Lachnospiraceae bacterium]